MLSREKRDRTSLPLLVLVTAAVLTALAFSMPQPTFAQNPDEEAGPTAPAGDNAEDADTAAPAVKSKPQTTTKKTPGISLFELVRQCGWTFGIIFFLMSLVGVTIIVERILALRQSRIFPNELVADLGKLGGGQSGFDPRQAYRLCQRFPSAVSTVIRSMLLKVGRPHSEVEHAVGEASEREADRLYTNVRWLNLIAAVAPLVGLMGTVWGLIRAFRDTTNLAPGVNKADQLAGGIWIALITTLFGLVIAIVAAIFAHYFEGRITALFHRIDEMLFNLLPQIERYEGRVRFNRQSSESETVVGPLQDPEPPPEPPAPPRTVVAPK